MIPGWLLLLVSVAYVALLFAVAIIGDRGTEPAWLSRRQPWIYALALAVYCSSWTFYGAVGMAARTGFGYLPIYLGPILMLWLGWRMLERMILISNARGIVSIADFLSLRYGRVPGLAALVAVVALVAAVPYFSLQYHAVAMSVQVLTRGDAHPGVWMDPALYVALALALFAILFGTRHIDATEHHRGMVLAVAMESLLKLLAFVAVGLLALSPLLAGQLPAAAWGEAASSLFARGLPPSTLAQTLIAFFAILCLPRQFHVAVVECQNVADLRPARWIFGGYLVVVMAMVLPVTISGEVLLGATSPADTYVLALPLHMGSDWLALAAYLGGFSAATGMVIVASVALATMVSNDLVMPLLLRWRRLHAGIAIQQEVLWVRRITIMAIALMGFVWHRAVPSSSLAQQGLLAFAAVAQFAPALIGGLYWRGASRRGAVAGTAVGSAIWAYTLLLPALVGSGWLPWSSWLEHGPLGLDVLRPQALFGMRGWDPLTHGVFWSLLCNVAAYLLLSMRHRPSLRDQLTSTAFLDPYDTRDANEAGNAPANVRGSDLLALAERIVGERAARRAFASYRHANGRGWTPEAAADRAQLQFTERLLASAIGADSARLTLTSALRGSGMPLGEVMELLDQAGEALRFNRDMLHTTLDNIAHGVSVVDADLRLVTWNARYQEMFDYPASMLYVGRPVADLLRWNAERGEMGEGDVDGHIERRLAHMRAATAHVFERVRANGQVLEIRGQPLPSGGYVTTFSDITAFKLAEQALRDSNETLEQRVEQRTREAEVAQQAKTRFLAAVSHDLLQPLNAARLFTSALREADDNEEQRRLGERVDASLRSAEDLLDGLLDISRLDAGKLTPQRTVLDGSELLRELAAQYAPIALKRGLSLRVQAPHEAWLESDRRLLRRALQNFIGNAMRYTREGGVLLAARKRGSRWSLEVWDTGAGIHTHHLEQIFEEFRRFDQPGSDGEQGLGLGLSICQRIAGALGHGLSVRSRVGLGSVFAITVEASQRTDGPAVSATSTASTPAQDHDALQGLRVLCVDNDPDILDGMRALLLRWQVDVRVATNVDDALAQSTWKPEVLLLDFHLHDRMDGLALLQTMRMAMNDAVPAALVSGDGSEEVLKRARSAGCTVLSKPVKPAALRAFLSAQAQRR